MNTYLLTEESKSFKTLKENYGNGLTIVTYLIKNVKHGIEHESKFTLIEHESKC